jgi:hypothetical protein
MGIRLTVRLAQHVRKQLTTTARITREQRIDLTRIR